MLKLLLITLGWTLAHAPEAPLRLLAGLLGDGIFFCLPRRRRLVLSNLHHAFPEKSRAGRRAIGRESCRRLVETSLLSLALPYLDEARLRGIVRTGPEFAELYPLLARAEPTIFVTPHLAYWEVLTALPFCVPGPLPEIGVVFRPLDDPSADAFVKRTRERFGIRLLSRRGGFTEAFRILRRHGIVDLLFDQNAGMQGALTLFLGRVCSTTELPGIMAEKFNARVFAIHPRRLGFWRAEIRGVRLPGESTAAAVTLACNRWLEETLRSDENACASWLWVHDRWRHQDVPAKRLRLESRRNLLDPATLAAAPRRTRIRIRLPNWLGDVVMTLPLLRALRASRPDAELTLVARAAFLPLLREWRVADRLEPLPARGPGYFAHFLRRRLEYPDVALLFTHSVRGDLEAWLTRAPQRFGIVRPGRARPLLTAAWRAPAACDGPGCHQFDCWEQFLRHFGLAAPADRTPFAPVRAPRPDDPVGLICGSENLPLKRWPVGHWRTLIAAFPTRRFLLFGTAGDRAITSEVAAGFPPERVEDLAGATALTEFAARLRTCALLVTNDTGGMHLANAVGVPVLALFGPTNPLRTGPVFSAPVRLLQPPGCAPTGGGALDRLAPETVAAELSALLSAADAAPAARPG